MSYNNIVVGVWRRLVARYLGVVEAVGSSPVTPTIRPCRFFCKVFFVHIKAVPNASPILLLLFRFRKIFIAVNDTVDKSIYVAVRSFTADRYSDSAVGKLVGNAHCRQYGAVCAL